MLTKDYEKMSLAWDGFWRAGLGLTLILTISVALRFYSILPHLSLAAPFFAFAWWSFWENAASWGYAWMLATIRKVSRPGQPWELNREMLAGWYEEKAIQARYGTW